MDNILSQFFSFQTIVFCLVISALVWAERQAIELSYPKVLTKTWWNDFLVPLGPVMTGAILAALVISYPYPDLFKDFWTSRAAYGIFCGMFSGIFYRLIKKNLLEKLQENDSALNKNSKDDSGNI